MIGPLNPGDLASTVNALEEQAARYAEEAHQREIAAEYLDYYALHGVDHDVQLQLNATRMREHAVSAATLARDLRRAAQLLTREAGWTEQDGGPARTAP